jgi:hypothetical protein
MFFDKYVPDAKLPDRRVLSGRILTGEAEKVVQRTRQLTDGKLATYSEDGWTNIAKTHVDTSLISVEAQVRLISLYIPFIDPLHTAFLAPHPRHDRPPQNRR